MTDELPARANRPGDARRLHGCGDLLHGHGDGAAAAVLITRGDGSRLMLGTDEPRRLKAAFDRAHLRPSHDRMRA